MMRKEFQNLKISITDEVHLKAVCDVLESMGYYHEPEFSTESKNIGQVITWDDGAYHLHKGSSQLISKQATLTDLLRMRDAQVMKKIHAAKT